MTSSEFFVDEIDAMRDLVHAGLVQLGFTPIYEPIIHRDVKWRPDIADLDSDPPIAVHISMDGLVPDWLDLESARETVPKLKFVVVIPDVVPVPHATIEFATTDKNTAVYALKSDEMELVYDAANHHDIDPARFLDYSAVKLKGLGKYADEFKTAVRICNQEDGDALYAVGIAGRVLERACKDLFNAAIDCGHFYFSRRRADKKLEKWDSIIYTLYDPTYDTTYQTKKRTYNKNRSLISNGQRDQLLMIKEARNTADHPATSEDEEEVIENAPSYIRISFGLIKRLLERRKKLAA